MTDITLEQRAALVADLRAAVTLGRPLTRAEVDEIEAALRLSAGADWVLMPAVSTGEMDIAGMEAAEVLGFVSFNRLSAEAVYRAMLAAAPRHETGEGS